MIVDLLIAAFLGVLNAVLALIPDFEIFTAGSRGPTGDLVDEQNWADSIGNLLALWDLFVPIELFFVCLVAVFSTRVFVALAQLLRWVWSVLPFKSS